jgi:hypothetical protein
MIADSNGFANEETVNLSIILSFAVSLLSYPVRFSLTSAFVCDKRAS